MESPYERGVLENLIRLPSLIWNIPYERKISKKFVDSTTEFVTSSSVARLRARGPRRRRDLGITSVATVVVVVVSVAVVVVVVVVVRHWYPSNAPPHTPSRYLVSAQVTL